VELLQHILRRQRSSEGDEPTQEQRTQQESALIERVIRQTGRMNKLIGEMLDVTHMRAEAFTVHNQDNINIIEVVRRVVEQHTTPDHEVRLRTEETSLLGSIDEDRIEQVMNNLISNAKKYSAPGIPVIVTVEHGQEPDNTVIIAVRDEGRGIAEEEQEHIFDRFYRIRTHEHTRTDGLGLGLYIVREIVALHGGRIWLESSPGKGSTFYVSLPLTQQ
jgi:signal transduction histidine kinase